MATKKATKTVAVDEKVHIPAAIRKPSANDMLGMLTGGKKAEPKPAAKKKARPGLQLTPEAEALFMDFVPAKIIAEHFTTNLENVKAQLKTLLFGLWTDALWSLKSQPANPSLSVEADGNPDMSGIYIIQARFSVNANNRDEAIEFMRQSGLSDTKATAFVDGELDFDPITAIRPFYELMKGHKTDGGWVPATDAEQAVAERIMQLLLGQSNEPLTEEERGLAITVIPNAKVREGFLNRVCGYCETKEQLQAALTLITPVSYPKSAQFGISDTMEQRIVRLKKIATDILGTQLESGEEDDDE